jgi:hypothetical protein
MSADTLTKNMSHGDEMKEVERKKNLKNFPNARARASVCVYEPCAGNVLCLKSGISFFSLSASLMLMLPH